MKEITLSSNYVPHPTVMTYDLYKAIEKIVWEFRRRVKEYRPLHHWNGTINPAELTCTLLMWGDGDEMVKLTVVLDRDEIEALREECALTRRANQEGRP